MSKLEEPWSEKWKVIESLGAGGQGETRLVHSWSDISRLGVMKTILGGRESNRQRRGRMNMEVSALRVLYGASAKVPNVLDENMKSSEDLETPLYFVMTFIEGLELSKFIDDRGKLGVNEAIVLLQQIAETVQIGHQNSLLHRDLKPENIIVNDDGGVLRPFVVDYGLSANDQVAVGDLTEMGEHIGNTFLRLPENNANTGNKRDHRSDVTCLVGILFFLLTGKSPGILQDQDQILPHRRPGLSLREHLVDDGRVNALDAFFDRGFRYAIGSRFQSLDEMLRRLEAIASDSPQPEETIEEWVAHIESYIIQNDRPTQLNRMMPVADKIKQTITKKVGSELGKSSLITSGSNSDDTFSLLPPGVDRLETMSWRFVVGTAGDKMRKRPAAFVQIGAREDQLVVFRADGVVDLNNKSNLEATLGTEAGWFVADLESIQLSDAQRIGEKIARDLLKRLAKEIDCPPLT